MVAFFAMASAWFNWGFSLIFSAMLAKEVARRVRRVDYRAVAAAAFLGRGIGWPQGLSGSAPLQMATPAGLQASYDNCMGWSQLLAALKMWVEHGINLREGMYK